MKVLLITWNFPPVMGGIEELIGNLYRGLVRRGISMRVLASRPAGEALLEDDQGRIVRASKPGLKAFVLFSLFRGLPEAFRFRPDVILCGSLVAAPAGYLIARLLRRRYVVITYGSDLVHGGRMYRFALRFFLRRAERLVAISHFTRALFPGAGLDPDRAVLIPPGVDVSRFVGLPEPAPHELAEACEGRKVLLTVGRLVRRKGVLDFVQECLPELVRRHPDLLYVVVGEDARLSLIHNQEGMRARIESAISDAGLQGHVRLTGSLDERTLNWLLYRAELFLLPVLDLPGDKEGFGIVFLEAALGGTPSVAYSVGGVPDAIGETGLLVKPGDSAAMIEAVSGLLSDETLRAKLGRAAERRAREEFNWDAICARYETLLRSTSRQIGLSTESQS